MTLSSIYRCESAKPPPLSGPTPIIRCDRDTSHSGPHRHGATVWEDTPPKLPQPTPRDMKIRQWAVEQVIAWLGTFENCDEEDDDEDWVNSTPEIIVAHARTFEAYIKGETPYA